MIWVDCDADINLVLDISITNNLWVSRYHLVLHFQSPQKQHLSHECKTPLFQTTDVMLLHVPKSNCWRWSRIFLSTFEIFGFSKKCLVHYLWRGETRSRMREQVLENTDEGLNKQVNIIIRHTLGLSANKRRVSLSNSSINLASSMKTMQMLQLTFDLN